MNRKTLAVVDLFCGAGGLSTGFASASAWWEGAPQAGYDVVFSTDRDKQAMQTFRANHFPEIPSDREDPRAFCGDVSLVNFDRILTAAHTIKQIDVLIGGPSCQGVSPAGLRNPADKRNQTLLAFTRLVKELQPLWFVMENVPGLTHSNNRQLLADILKLFESMEGYQVAGDVLLAADYGVPQFRYRLFIIGTRTGAPIRFPVPQREIGYLNVRQAIYDLSNVEPVEYDKGELPTQTPCGVKNHWCRRIGEVDRKRIARVRPGHDWRDIPIELLPERYFTTRSSDQKGSYGRLTWDWPAYTITNASHNVSAGAFTHPEHNRCLSVREAAHLQSFPGDYEFYGSVEAQYRQVGNAVPPRLAKAVAEAILYAHFNPETAKTWGRKGRLTHELVKRCLKGEAIFPTLTPRRVHPATARSTRAKTSPKLASTLNPEQFSSAWSLEPRPEDPRPEDTRRLRRLADQPKNFRAAKRARAIVHFIDGMSRADIVNNANVSETSVQKWIDGYFTGGLDGWRAFHSSFDHLAKGNPRVKIKIAQKIARARKILLSPRKEQDTADTPKRLHMNAYLRNLVQNFGTLSVEELITKVERVAGTSLGTIYVSDLLAVADVALAPGEVNDKDDLEAKEYEESLTDVETGPAEQENRGDNEEKEVPLPVSTSSTTRTDCTIESRKIAPS
jgi:DNA (cytosine-5)-methyltransferase 1